MKKIEPQILQQDEVIFVDNRALRGNEAVMVNTTFRADELLARLKNDYTPEILVNNNSSISCQVLSPGKNWRKGTFRLAVIFTPDEEPPESDTLSNSSTTTASPLDEIRLSRTRLP
jgi:KGK domain